MKSRSVYAATTIDIPYGSLQSSYGSHNWTMVGILLAFSLLGPHWSSNSLSFTISVANGFNIPVVTSNGRIKATSINHFESNRLRSSSSSLCTLWASTMDAINDGDDTSLSPDASASDDVKTTSSTTNSTTANDASSPLSMRPPCYWQPKESLHYDQQQQQHQQQKRRRDKNDNKIRAPRWRPRIHIDDLNVGDQLNCSYVVQELLDGKTGPKVYVECGVGRTSKIRSRRIKRQNRSMKPTTKPITTSSSDGNDDDVNMKQAENDNDESFNYEANPLNGEVETTSTVIDSNVTSIKWSIVNGMIRLGPKGMKSSVVKKRLEKLRNRNSFPVWVTRVQRGCGRLEVCARESDLQPYLTDPKASSTKKKIPVMSLQPGQEVNGTVVKVFPYGVTVDVGANRRGLLHVRKIASLYDQYIDKEDGIIKSGLSKGTRVRLQVESTESRRLFLDFTNDVKDSAEKERRRQKEQQIQKRKNALKDQEHSLSADNDDDDDPNESIEGDDSLDDWAAYAEQIASTASSSTVGATETDADGETVYDSSEEYDYNAYDEDEDEDEDEDSMIEEALGLDMY